MCGLFGLIQEDPIDFFELNSMSKYLKHRGPDDEGFVTFDSNDVQIFGGIDTPDISMNVDNILWSPTFRLPSQGMAQSSQLVLGHRRLSIIDPSPLGHQPMCSIDRSCWISFNGEIYNFLELREELRALGHSFCTDTDTEVIIAAYQQWGYDCLSKFNGMFALVIFDQKSKTLFLARDRFGVKPLYYWQVAGRLAFSSEIKAFTCLTGWNPYANKEKLLDFIVWNIADHSSSTMFDGVEQLLPGHFVTINLSNLFSGGSVPELSPQQWYVLPSNSSPVDELDASQKLLLLLRDSVQLRLRADVPVGSCLSGGLDSSAIVCLMQDAAVTSTYGNALYTFTARSHDHDFDEYRYAEKVIERSSTISHQVIPELLNLFNELDDLIWHQDEPFVSTSIYAQWCLFRKAHDVGIKVMLDGQGADEILGGYRGYFGAYLASLVQKGFLVQWFGQLVALRRESGFSYARSIGYTFAYLFPSLFTWFGKFDGRAYSDKTWLAEGVRDAFRFDPFLAVHGRSSSVKDLSIAQITKTNLPMLLHWEDRNSMAHSVEARVPFLDYRVVETCLEMSDSSKVGGGISKRVLREAMNGIVPDFIIKRRDKMGFVTAEQLWMSRDDPQQFRRELIDAIKSLPSILSPRLLNHFDEMVEGRRSFDFRYWRAICASRWVKRFAVRVL